MGDFTRRKFLQSASVLAAGTFTLPSFARASSPGTGSDVRIGFIGTGLRGRNHVNNILSHEGVHCPAICDIDPDAITKTKEIFAGKGKKEPRVYGGSNHAYLEMLEKEDLDGVIIATNWKWHTPMCLAAMRSGVYTGVEVSGAFSVDECWELVRTHQQTGTHLFFLENVNYRRDVLAVLNMVRDNVFGELLHLRGGYQHDLRQVKFNDGKGGLKFGEDSYGEARWRTEHSIRRNGELYPTHGLGPLNAMLNVNRGNRLTSISSFATKSKGLHQYILDHPEGGENHPFENINWKLSLLHTSLQPMAKPSF